MTTIVSPRNEKITVKKRWFPWPHITKTEKLEETGMSDSASSFLGKKNFGDYAILGVLTLIYLIVLVMSPVFFVVLLALTVVGLVVNYLGLPWTIEVIHEGKIVESEKSVGFSATTLRVQKIAALYTSGALKLPAPKPTPQPRVKSAVPVPDTLPELVIEENDSRPTLSTFNDSMELPTLGSGPSESTAFDLSEKPDLEESLLIPDISHSSFEEDNEQKFFVESPVLKEFLGESIEEEDSDNDWPELETNQSRPVSTSVDEESPLRRAIRMMEEEENLLKKGKSL